MQYQCYPITSDKLNTSNTLQNIYNTLHYNTFPNAISKSLMWAKWVKNRDQMIFCDLTAGQVRFLRQDRRRMTLRNPSCCSAGAWCGLIFQDAYPAALQKARDFCVKIRLFRTVSSICFAVKFFFIHSKSSISPNPRILSTIKNQSFLGDSFPV